MTNSSFDIMRKTKYTLLSVCLVLLTWACNSTTTSEFENTLERQDEEINAYLSDNNISGTERLSSGLYKKVVVNTPEDDQEDENKVENNDRLGVYYVIKDLNKNIIGSHTAADGAPVPLLNNTSPSTIIPGCFDRALRDQYIGDSVTIFSASPYAYNTIEWENNITTDMPIFVEIKIVSKVDTEGLAILENTKIEQYIEDNKVENSWLDENIEELEGGIWKITTVVGTGESPKPPHNGLPGETVALEYTGYLLNGAEFDSSVSDDKGTDDKEDDDHKPFVFKLGIGVISGWSIAIETMRVGDQATIIIPSAQAYGSSGNRLGASFFPSELRDFLMEEGTLNNLPADAILVFDLNFLASREDAIDLQ